MSTGQTNWNFRHIEFLIDIAEDLREINKLSATKLKRYMELKAIDLVKPTDDFEGKYAELTAKGKECLGALEDEFVRLQDYLNSNVGASS